jgi:hypothetical protein
MSTNKNDKNDQTIFLRPALAPLNIDPVNCKFYEPSKMKNDNM